MGNCLALCEISTALAVPGKHQEVVKIVKIDGEIVKFSASIPVNVLLVNFPGFRVSASGKASDCLPLGYKLELGNTYYLVSPFDAEHSPGEVSQAIETEENGSIGRIKLVITKQQLQQLLSKKVSFDDVVCGVDTAACFADSSPRCWKPKLEAIPEGNEFCYVS